MPPKSDDAPCSARQQRIRTAKAFARTHGHDAGEAKHHQCILPSDWQRHTAPVSLLRKEVRSVQARCVAAKESTIDVRKGPCMSIRASPAQRADSGRSLRSRRTAALGRRGYWQLSLPNRPKRTWSPNSHSVSARCLVPQPILEERDRLPGASPTVLPYTYRGKRPALSLSPACDGRARPPDLLPPL